MYPWESCPVHGDEVTPGARPYTEDHVTFDVAVAFASYWKADAIVHLGKHGTLEWLPGKMLALSASCAPDAALADVPLQEVNYDLGEQIG